MSTLRQLSRRVSQGLVALALVVAYAATAHAQAAPEEIIKVSLSSGRSYAVSADVNVERASVADPAIADAIPVSAREVSINGKAAGETDVIIWLANGERRHYRVIVAVPSDRLQILVSVKFAEVRRDALMNLGFSYLYQHTGTRVGTDVYKSNQFYDPTTGATSIPFESSWLTLLSDFGSKDFRALINIEEQKGNAHTLAEPNIMAADHEDASFLAGGEIPIPIAQPTGTAYVPVTVQYREFGIRLNFNGTIISDSLIRLKIRPEVSSLDWTNAIILSGFRIPALRTRRMESTLDVKRDQSLVISGLFSDERSKIRTGIPFLMDVPILGNLFGSTSWQRNQTELVVIVTPIVIDPMHPPFNNLQPFTPDSIPTGRGALDPKEQEKSLPPR